MIEKVQSVFEKSKYLSTNRPAIAGRRHRSAADCVRVAVGASVGSAWLTTKEFAAVES